MNVFTCLGWDAVDMGKTIALKLTKKEEQFISDINSRGMTNSELLRLALRQFIESLPEFSSEGSAMRTMFVKQDHVSADVFETVQQLKSEMQMMQCQLERIEKQVESDVQAMHQKLSRLNAETPHTPACASTMQQGQGNLYEIHHQIDDFLGKHQQSQEDETQQ